MVPEYLSPRPVEWFKSNWQDQDSGIGIGRGSDQEPTKTGRLSTRMGEIVAFGRVRSITCFLSCARLTPSWSVYILKMESPPYRGSSAPPQPFGRLVVGCSPQGRRQ